MNLIVILVLCVIVYKLMSSGNIRVALPSFKGVFKFIPNVRGEKMTLMSKRCEVCGKKTIYLEGDNTSSLKAINVVDPDSGEVVTKKACDHCYNELMDFMKQEKSDKIELSKELKNLTDIIKNS